jgi:nucleotide-binding universal stress UspA family protein
MTDFSPESMHATPYVSGIAKKLGSAVYLAHVVTPNALVASAPEVAPTVYETMREEAAMQLTTMARSRELADLDTKTVLTSGHIDHEVRNMVADKRIDLVVAGTHGRTGIRKLMLGSVVETVCRVASCPVLTVGPGLAPRGETGFKRVIFPTDLSEDSKKILPYLRLLAEEYKAEITVLHVMPEELINNPDAAKLAEPIRRNMMHVLGDELAGANLEFVVAFGETGEAVLRTARAMKADLIAMGIHNAFLPGVHLRSSLAYRIMAGAHCPVLTVR